MRQRPLVLKACLPILDDGNRPPKTSKSIHTWMQKLGQLCHRLLAQKTHFRVARRITPDFISELKIGQGIWKYLPKMKAILGHVSIRHNIFPET